MAKPRKPAKLFPGYLVNEREIKVDDTPTYMGGTTYVNWPVAWSYTFERGDGPLIGIPALPPGVV